MNQNRVIVAGSLNADLVVTAERLPRLGESVPGSSFQTFPGGKGANQAVAAARLGGQVYHVGKVGDDSFGEMLKQSLNSSGVDTSFVEVARSESTGVALITVDKAGDNTLVIVPGANGKCDPEFVRRAIEKIEADLLVMQLEIPLLSVRAAARAAREKGIKVLLNPAPARELDDELIRDVDIIVMNETEAEVITKKTVTDRNSAITAARTLVERGVGEVVVTLGKKGAVYVSRQVEIFVPSFEVESVDTTAAGDAFVGGLATRLGLGEDINSVLRYASAAGALTVTKMGAQSSLPTAFEVEHFLRAQA